jgi:alanine dehydrogenase
VGAILIHGRKTPHIVTEPMVKQMRPGRIVLDISIDQGGVSKTSRPTALSDEALARAESERQSIYLIKL